MSGVSNTPSVPYYEDDSVTLYHGDCLAILPELKPVDLVLTDPPYNFGFEYGEHDDKMDVDAYREWCREWFALLREKSSRIVIFPGHGNLPVWWEVSKPSSIGCWHKPGNFASSHLGFAEWEPYLYWGTRVGGSTVTRATVNKQRDTGDHPCPKPLSLMRSMLVKFAPESVLDPFAGSGSTLRAAKDLGIPSTGIEIEERYCAVAASRCAQEVLAA